MLNGAEVKKTKREVARVERKERRQDPELTLIGYVRCSGLNESKKTATAGEVKKN